MSNCTHRHHENHDHQHGAGCGHTAVRQGDHVDYLHDGHLHHPHGDTATTTARWKSSPAEQAYET